MSTFRRAPIKIGAALSALVCAATFIGTGPASAADPQAADVALDVLVIDDGSPMTDAVKDRLVREGQHFTTVDLSAADRAAITSDFLVAKDKTGVHGKFSGIVLPNAEVTQLSAAERALIDSYSSAFKVRQVLSYTWANPEVGLNYAQNPGFSGTVDGMRATVTTEGAADAFSYLKGVTLDDVDSAVTESYGYLATPVDTSFTPLVTTAIPNSDAKGSLIGVQTKDGRERMVITFASNKYQNHWRTLSHGVVRWLTRGISTTYNRNFLSVHVDDVLLPDTLWSEEGNCTIGDGCDPKIYPETAPGATSRMVPSDVTRLLDWQQANGIKLDMVYNGGGASEYKQEFGTDPLESELLKNKSQLRWVNHTWTHPYLGCVQDFSTPEWKCARNGWGDFQYYPFFSVVDELARNDLYAVANRLPNYDRTSVVTGEHSGLKTLPQMETDSPFLAPALRLLGFKWAASDASREFDQREVGDAALTVPRHPMNVFYNTETKSQAVDEYNWFYNSAADGGSGLCEKLTQTMTCIKPLDKATGYDSYIVPLETRIGLGHVLGNDPRPHYVHQSNLAADGILYPVVGSMVSVYRNDFADNTPLINPAMADAGAELQRQGSWKDKQTVIKATVSGNTVKLTNSSKKNLQVPLTLPAGATKAGKSFGSTYGGEFSGWENVSRSRTNTYTLAQDSGFASSVAWDGGETPKGAPVNKGRMRSGGTSKTTKEIRLNQASSEVMAEARKAK